MTELSLQALTAALVQLPRFADLAQDALVAMPRKGLAHAHYRMPGGRTLVRVPLAAFGGLDPAASLVRQEACFARAQASDATPRVLGSVAPCAGVPFGALVVDDIPGAAPNLPGDLGALANALGALHKLRVPDADGRAPIHWAADPLGELVAGIVENLKLAPRASLDPKVEVALGHELAWAREFTTTNAKRFAGLTRALCLVDAHPGNFVVAPGGRAYAVDLERCAYTLPGFDLAHACSLPATSWDVDCAASLNASQIDNFVRAWATRVGDPIARETVGLFRPFRRLIWLRTTCVFVRFKAEGTHKALEPRAAEHAQKSIDAALDIATIVAQRKAWS
jgi:hypothetical protein